MFPEHRTRTSQETFHSNLDYALWYDWSEMQRDLTEIKTMAAEMRKKAKTEKKLFTKKDWRIRSEKRRYKDENSSLLSAWANQ